MALKDHYRWYVSLERVKAELGISVTTHDDVLKDQIEAAAGLIDTLTDRIFVPETRTKYFDAPLDDTHRLVLGRDLLSLTSATDDKGALTLADLFLYSGDGELNVPPYTQIEILKTSDFWYWSDTRQKALTIVGEWGYCSDYEDTGAVLAAAIASATATTFTCTTGKVKTGDSLLIDTEQMFVSGVVTSTSDTITVKRAQGGTTGAAHDNAKTIYRYVVPADVRKAVAELAKFYWKRRAGDGVKSERLGDYAVEYRGETMPPSVRTVIQRYERLVYGPD